MRVSVQPYIDYDAIVFAYNSSMKSIFVVAGRQSAEVDCRMPIAPRGPQASPPYHLPRRTPSLTLKCPSII